MPTRNYTKYANVNKNPNTLMESQTFQWDNSPRVNGKLVLRANKMTRLYNRVTHVSQSGTTHSGTAGIGIGWILPPLQNRSLTNVAAQRYQNRFAKAQASLLITALQWRETLGMITDRAKRIDRSLQSALDSPRVRRRSFRVNSDEVAGAYLEAKFGWFPLIKDIYDAMEVLALARVPPVHCRGSAFENVFIEQVTSGDPKHTSLITGRRRVTLAADLRLQNPNKWLASQLGLTNLGATAWDWIPWSFLVSMFSNMNAVIGQFSTDCGVSVSNVSTTYSLECLRDTVSVYGPSSAPTGRLAVSVNTIQKQRTLLNHPPVTLRLRLPSDPLSAAVTIVALVGQRARRITGALNIP